MLMVMVESVVILKLGQESSLGLPKDRLSFLLRNTFATHCERSVVFLKVSGKKPALYSLRCTQCCF